MDAEALRRSSAHVLVDELHDVLVLDGDVEHHLRRVLRLSTGETVSATDGAGRARLYVAEVGAGVELRATGDAQVSSVGPGLELVTAIPKGDRVDWLVQKCTELGVRRIRFVHAERSVVRWRAERAAKQLTRLQRIADEALRQSRRVHRVRLDAPVDASALLAACVVAEPGGRPVAATDRSIAIGPEGGWSAAELAVAADLVDLGTGVLRTETAAVAACVRAAAT